MFDAVVARLTAPEAREIDRGLPEWARRSNPIVRRHLGEYWKMMALDITVLARLFVLNGVVVLLSLPFPFLLTVLMPTVTVSFVLLPTGFVLYGQSLVMIGIISAIAVSDERRNGSLDLLRVCPRPLHQVLYSKVAAAVWRQLENLTLIITTLALFSLPLLIIMYDMTVSMIDNPVLMRVTVMLALASSLVRILLEAVMVGAIGTMVGASTSMRAPAVIATVLLTAAYFVFINLFRLVHMGMEARLFVEIFLPLILPSLIIPLCFRAAVHMLTRDN
jgi:hypothetical protein